MGLPFLRKDEKQTLESLSDEGIQTHILECLSILNKREKTKLIDTYFRLIEEAPERDAYLLTCFFGANRLIGSIFGGFYQIKSGVNIPFYPGDILFFSNKRTYQKGDILYMVEFYEKGEFNFHYVVYDYTTEDGKFIVKSCIKEDKKKYTVSPWKILGKQTYSLKFGTPDWEEFITKAGEDVSKIDDIIEMNIGQIEKIEDFYDKERVLTELKKRKQFLKSFVD